MNTAAIFNYAAITSHIQLYPIDSEHIMTANYQVFCVQEWKSNPSLLLENRNKKQQKARKTYFYVFFSAASFQNPVRANKLESDAVDARQSGGGSLAQSSFFASYCVLDDLLVALCAFDGGCPCT
jgi:hypothetical protein